MIVRHHFVDIGWNFSFRLFSYFSKIYLWTEFNFTEVQIDFNTTRKRAFLFLIRAKQHKLSKMGYFQACTKEQLLNCIYGEFNVTEESVKNDVSYLIEWMSQQPFLPDVQGTYN